MALDVNSFAAALKQHYTDWQIENMVYQDNPFFAMVNKSENFGGDVFKLPILIGNPQNRSMNFTNALAMTSTSTLRAFLLTRKSDYALAEISNEVMLASEGDANAFLRAATVEIDGALHALGRSVATKLFRNGSGSIGRLASTSGTTTTLTLLNPEDIVNFEVGMCLESNNTDNATSINTSTGSEGLITAIDRTLGVITLNTAITGLAASDYMFVRGDAAIGAISGLDAWITDNATALAASFFGVTRTVDQTRLAGHVVDGSSYTIEEALIKLATQIAREGGAPDVCFMNYKDYANLQNSLGSKVMYVDVKAGYEGAIAFRGIAINGPRGVIKCIPDQNTPVGYAYMLTMKSWKLASLKKAVNLFDGDGLKLLRSPSSDSLQIRTFSYSQLGCNAPGFNGKILLPQ